MTEEQVLDLAREAIYTLLKLGVPIMMTGLVIGLTVAIFQALTQIQEMTLTFVPKIIVVFVALIILAPYMIDTLQAFMSGIADKIISLE